MRAWLKQARENKQLTEKQVADRLRISENYYTSIESGKSQKQMDLALIERLSVLLDVSTETIIELEREKSRSIKEREVISWQNVRTETEQ